MTASRCLRSLAAALWRWRPFRPPHRSSRAAAGAWGESIAARHLRRRGLRILARNYRVRGGEIDLVALEGATLVFVEVKAFSGASRGGGIDRIDATKRKRLRRAALAFLARRRPRVDGWRIDGVEVEFEIDARGRRRPIEVRWWPHLFSLE